MFAQVLARAFAPVLRWRDRRPLPADIPSAQGRVLSRLVRALAPLAVGRRFGLEALTLDANLVHAFRDRIRPTAYGDYASLIAAVARGEAGVMFPGRAVALAQTSGTTSTTTAGERYIPQGRELLAQHRDGGAAALVRLLDATGPELLAGKLLMLGGSTALHPNPAGIPVGDLSGICVGLIPRALANLYEPGRSIAWIEDWDRKVAAIAQRCSGQDIRLVSGIPSWCLVLFDAIRARAGVERVRDAWPRLTGMIHGGHAIGAVLPRLRDQLAPTTWMMEVYPASEAFIGVGTRPWRLDEMEVPPLDLLTDHGVFLEFDPADGSGDPVIGAESLLDGRTYRVLITTPGGLIRYAIGDLVTGVGPGVVRFAGRIKTRLSVFGEHVEGAHLDQAIEKACAATGAEVAHYHVAPILPSAADPRGGHEWWIEFHRPPGDGNAFTEHLDRHLCAAALDYAAHRRLDQQLRAPTMIMVPQGTFRSWLGAHGKLGGQHKVPQAWEDRTVADLLAHHARDRNHVQARSIANGTTHADH